MSTVLNWTTAVLSIGGSTLGFLSIMAAIEAAIKATTQAITIPAMAPPDKPLEFFLYTILLLLGVVEFASLISILAFSSVIFKNTLVDPSIPLLKFKSALRFSPFVSQLSTTASLVPSRLTTQGISLSELDKSSCKLSFIVLPSSISTKFPLIVNLPLSCEPITPFCNMSTLSTFPFASSNLDADSAASSLKFISFESIVVFFPSAPCDWTPSSADIDNPVISLFVSTSPVHSNFWDCPPAASAWVASPEGIHVDSTDASS